jgi:hypothetical protein
LRGCKIYLSKNKTKEEKVSWENKKARLQEIFSALEECVLRED